MDFISQSEAATNHNQQPEIKTTDPTRTLETVTCTRNLDQSQTGIVDSRKRKAYSPAANQQPLQEANQPISSVQQNLHQQAAESSASVSKIARLASQVQVAPQQFQLPAANQVQAAQQTVQSGGLQLVRLANGQQIQQIVPSTGTPLLRTQIPPQAAQTSRIHLQQPQIVQVNPPQTNLGQVNPQQPVISQQPGISQPSQASINSAGRPTAVTQMALQTKVRIYIFLFLRFFRRFLHLK